MAIAPPMTRRLGRAGIEVSAVGLGCWQIGGTITQDGLPHGFDHAEDEGSVRAMQRALELGVNFFDTADIYGAGHSERLVARALGARRKDVIITTKFGIRYDEDTKIVGGFDGSEAYVRWACEQSLRRLETDYIDLYMLHPNTYPVEQAVETRDALEKLVAEGKIRWYAWSTSNPEGAAIFAQGPNCVAIQHALNVFEGSLETLALCEREGLASISMRPLGLGLLAGKFTSESTLPDSDPRIHRMGWSFKEGDAAGALKRLDAIREILTSGGRTVAQGALAWIWGKSDATIPIPGFSRISQVEDNARAMEHGPLMPVQMLEIEDVLAEQP